MLGLRFSRRFLFIQASLLLNINDSVKNGCSSKGENNTYPESSSAMASNCERLLLTL